MKKRKKKLLESTYVPPPPSVSIERANEACDLAEKRGFASAQVAAYTGLIIGYMIAVLWWLTWLFAARAKVRSIEAEVSAKHLWRS